VKKDDKEPWDEFTPILNRMRWSDFGNGLEELAESFIDLILQEIDAVLKRLPYTKGLRAWFAKFTR
jgi:hypothetical protein